MATPLKTETWDSPEKKNNYMSEFLSEESKEICRNIVEKYRLLELEKAKPKPRGRKKK